MSTSGMCTWVFWQDASERAVSSFAATLLSEWTATAASSWVGVNLATVDWKTSLGLAGGAALYSLVKSVAATQFGDPTSASLLRRQRWSPPAGKHEK